MLIPVIAVLDTVYIIISRMTESVLFIPERLRYRRKINDPERAESAVRNMATSAISIDKASGASISETKIAREPIL